MVVSLLGKVGRLMGWRASTGIVKCHDTNQRRLLNLHGQTKVALFVGIFCLYSDIADANFLSLDISTQIRQLGNATSTVIGATTSLRVNPNNNFRIFLNRIVKETGDIERFGISYRLNYSDHSNIVVQISNTVAEAKLSLIHI